MDVQVERIEVEKLRAVGLRNKVAALEEVGAYDISLTRDVALK